MRARRAAGLVFFAILGALVLASCGGGGGGDDGGDSADAADAATTTTAAAKAKAPAEGPALALTLADLGGEWKQATPATGVQTAPDDNCAQKVGGIPGLVESGRYVGPVLQRGTANYYVGSTTYVFEDEAAAQAEIEKRRSQPYQDCRVAQLIEDEKKASPDVKGVNWRVSNVGDAKGAGENGFELQLDYQFQADIDGTVQDANGVQQQILYRHGRYLVDYAMKGSFAEGDPPTRTTDVGVEFGKAIDEAQKRAPTT